LTAMPRSAPATGRAYPMRRWIAEDCPGRFDIDLGDGQVHYGGTARPAARPDLSVSHGHDAAARLAQLIAERYGSTADRVAVTHGAREALSLLCLTLLKPGDRVLAFSPGWQQARDIPERLGCDVRLRELPEDLGPHLDALAGDRAPRLITLTRPHGPAGRRLRGRELAALAALAARGDGYLVLDEEHLADLAASPAVHTPRVISLASLARIPGLPGLRVGWMYAPPEIAAACARDTPPALAWNPVPYGPLALDVLSRWPGYARRHRSVVEEGRRLVGEFAARHPAELRLLPAHGDGAPFAWLRLTTGEAPLSFARRALDAGVLITPGETLGVPGAVRLSLAREPAVLAEALARIGRTLAAAPDPAAARTP
jgi:aspartate/methionine/tyrosine aminotransferase